MPHDPQFPGALVVNHPVARAPRWARLPSQYDVTHGRVLYPTDGNCWGIPVIRRGAPPPRELAPYCPTDRRVPAVGQGCHFFIDDYRFERVWTQLEAGLRYVQRFGQALSPDFSVRLDHPLAVVVYQVYRNRWIGAYWQHHGIRVVPSVNWTTPASYDICFAGLESGGCFAICCTSAAIHDDCARALRHGCSALVERLAPRALLVYGDPVLLPKLDSRVEILPYRPGNPRNPGRRVAHWYCIVPQPNGRFGLWDADRLQFERLDLTEAGLWRLLSARMPTQDAQRLLRTGTTGDPGQFRTWGECCDAVQQAHGAEALAQIETTGTLVRP